MSDFEDELMSELEDEYDSDSEDESFTSVINVLIPYIIFGRNYLTFRNSILTGH
ncbi:hypothetical protein HDV02_002289, partial [Globomyces sp. JEL0801]